MSFEIDILYLLGWVIRPIFFIKIKFILSSLFFLSFLKKGIRTPTSLVFNQSQVFDISTEKILQRKKVLTRKGNMKADYADKMIKKGFQLVTVGSDQRFMSGGSKESLAKFKQIKPKESKGY